jgi:hypothetical protein
MNKRRSILQGLLAFAGVGSMKKAVAAEQDGRIDAQAKVGRSGAGAGLPVLFTYRTLVLRFGPATAPGTTVTFFGDDVGTADGILTGALIQTFNVTVNPTTGAANTGPDRALFTDLDRDQISFEYAGTGIFLPPSNIGKLMSAGGSLAVTYTVLEASGKYQFLIGRQFPAAVIATNMVNSSSGVVGVVYAEVYAHDAKSIKKTLDL